jgi:hypothetical protein
MKTGDILLSKVGALMLICSELRCAATLYKNEYNEVRFDVFTAVAMKNGVFWDVTPRGPCKNRRFGGT